MQREPWEQLTCISTGNHPGRHVVGMKHVADVAVHHVVRKVWVGRGEICPNLHAQLRIG